MTKFYLLRILALIYLLVFIGVIFAIFLVHMIPSPFLDIVRLPTFLRLAHPSLARSWPLSLHIYQAVLVFYLFITVIDAFSLFFFSSHFLRRVSLLSSYIGFFIMGGVVGFFLYTLLFISPLNDMQFQQAVFFLLLSLFLFLLDLFTFLVDEESQEKLRLKIGRLSFRKSG